MYMNEVKKVILFLLCCAIPFSFYAQKARQNAVTKKWGYEQTENKGWWENSKYRGNSMFGGWDAALVNQDYEINNATLMERNRIAREIHDTLGHTMTGLSAGIDACIALIDYSVDETKKQLSIISGVARQGLKDVRRSMKKLRPDTLERESLESAIEKLITETMSTSKVSIEFQSFLPSLVFEDDEEDTIYRIVQEGITNAIRHGHASRIFINFKKVDIWLVIRIRDNGIGCKDIHKGFGLTHMKERVDMLHGTVTYSSNNGFQVVAKLPIRWRNEER